MSVILGRAMPDVRDGLKPVHRRILYAMYKLRLGTSGPFRKSARVVGEVLGKYHPHGDSAVYDALVRMAQPFSMSVPLVDGHGNFGSTDGDPAAAMRYTECRLAALAQHGLMADLDRTSPSTSTTSSSSSPAIIDFFPNFDASDFEPSVLPAAFPNLLVNGSSGIAVGMATNIPPHNLTEVVNACIALIHNPDLDDNALFRVVPGPDFPTGGYILGTADSRAVYRTGRGRIIVRACVHTEVIHADGTTTTTATGDFSSTSTSSATNSSGSRKKREALIITQLPYQVNKAGLVEKVAALVNDKKLDGIADLRDESDRTGTRIVIELKRDARAPLVLQALFKKTALQASFAANMMALDNGRFPQRFTLRQFLVRFLDFRRAVVRRRMQYDLNTAQLRLHIVEGYMRVLSDIDKAVALVRSAKDTADAKRSLMTQFDLSDTQAIAVLDLQLRRLTALEMDKLVGEQRNLIQVVDNLTNILASPQQLDDVIVRELKQVAAQYGTPRRSKIVTRQRQQPPGVEGTNGSSSEDGEFGLDMMHDEIDEMTLVQNVQSVITVTRHGYIKRMGTSLFESQGRGTRGKRGIGRLRAGDKITHLFTCMTHDPLIAVSADGMAFPIPAYRVPAGNTTSRGVPVFQLISSVPDGQTTDIAAVVPVDDVDRTDDFIVLVSQGGFVKRVRVSEIVRVGSDANTTTRGKRVIGLKEDDRLRFVKRCKENDSAFIATKNGLVLRFCLDPAHLRSSGRMSRGVIAMRLGDGDELADMDIVHTPISTADANGAATTEGATGAAIAGTIFEGDAAIGLQRKELEGGDKSDKLNIQEQDAELDDEFIDDNGDENDERDNDGAVFDDGEDSDFLLLVTKYGKGKRVRCSAFPSRRRRGKGLIAMKLDNAPDSHPDNGPDCVVAMQSCRSGDSVMLVASDGTLVRTKVNKIPVQGRMSKGVRLQKLADDVTVAAVTVVSGDILGNSGALGSDDDDEDDDDEDDDEEDDDEEDDEVEGEDNFDSDDVTKDDGVDNKEP